MHTLNTPDVPLLAALPAHPGFGESLAYQLHGLIVVFIALGLIWVAMTLLGAFFRRYGVAEVPAPTADVAPVAALTPVLPIVQPIPVPTPMATTVIDEIPAEVVAVIAAAVQLTLRGSAYRIQAIIPVPAGQDWAQEGRRQIFASHQIR